MENYIRYLEQVLGVKSVLLPLQAAQVPETEKLVPVNPHRIQVLFLANQSWSPKAQELFQKMRDAMKLNESATKLVFAHQTPESEWQILALSAERVVCFSKAQCEALSIANDFKFYTHDPEELLKKPELKKAAWEELKKVMKSLGIL